MWSDPDKLPYISSYETSKYYDILKDVNKRVGYAREFHKIPLHERDILKEAEINGPAAASIKKGIDDIGGFMERAEEMQGDEKQEAKAAIAERMRRS